MPEGDTLARTAAGLRPHVVGRTVTGARGRVPGSRIDLVVGTTVTAVESLGKNLVVRFDNGLEVRTHLGMRGSWHRYRPGDPWRRAPARASLVLEVPGSIAVCFDAPVVELLEQRARALHPVLGRLGPDLLCDDTDLDEAVSRLRAPERASMSIAEALLDQRALAGIGNAFKSEVLWEAGVSPLRTIGELDDALVRRLVERAQTLLRAGAATGRRPRRVYRRSGRPCPKCGTIVAVRRQGRDLPRLTFWCPTCQGDPADPSRAGDGPPGPRGTASPHEEPE